MLARNKQLGQNSDDWNPARAFSEKKVRFLQLPVMLSVTGELPFTELYVHSTEGKERNPSGIEGVQDSMRSAR